MKQLTYEESILVSQKAILEKYSNIEQEELQFHLTEDELETFSGFYDYDNKPIGGDNPYYECSCCGISDPQINSYLFNHSEYCDYRENTIKRIKG